LLPVRLPVFVSDEPPPLAAAGKLEVRSAARTIAARKETGVQAGFFMECSVDVWSRLVWKFFMLVKSRRVFVPAFVDLDFWKMFFISREILFLP
jgi:hypothetical protein